MQNVIKQGLHCKSYKDCKSQEQAVHMSKQLGADTGKTSTTLKYFLWNWLTVIESCTCLLPPLWEATILRTTSIADNSNCTSCTSVTHTKCSWSILITSFSG